MIILISGLENQSHCKDELIKWIGNIRLHCQHREKGGACDCVPWFKIFLEKIPYGKGLPKVNIEKTSSEGSVKLIFTFLDMLSLCIFCMGGVCVLVRDSVRTMRCIFCMGGVCPYLKAYKVLFLVLRICGGSNQLNQ